MLMNTKICFLKLDKKKKNPNKENFPEYNRRFTVSLESLTK